MTDFLPNTGAGHVDLVLVTRVLLQREQANVDDKVDPDFVRVKAISFGQLAHKVPKYDRFTEISQAGDASQEMGVICSSGYTGSLERAESHNTIRVRVRVWNKQRVKIQIAKSSTGDKSTKMQDARGKTQEARGQRQGIAHKVSSEPIKMRCMPT